MDYRVCELTSGDRARRSCCVRFFFRGLTFVGPSKQVVGDRHFAFGAEISNANIPSSRHKSVPDSASDALGYEARFSLKFGAVNALEKFTDCLVHTVKLNILRSIGNTQSANRSSAFRLVG